ncbi:MAG: hypothetical protein C4339_02700 [Nitrososphaerota archaeon]
MLEGARLTLLGALLALCLGLIGILLGILWLGALTGLFAGAPFLLLHARVQLYGSLPLFIMGVAYNLVPRFKNRRLAGRKLAYLSLGLVFVGNLLWLLEPGPEAAGGVLLAAGALLFSLLLLPLLGKPSGVLAVSEPYISLAVLLLPISALLLLPYSSQDPFSNDGLLYLALLGFPTTMIYGIFIRTIHFRDPFRAAVLRKRAAAVSFGLHGAALALTLLSLLEPRALRYASPLFLGSGLGLVYSVQGFRRLKDERQGRMAERDRVRYQYFSTAFTLALAWLLAGLALGFLYGTLGLLALRDAFIHSLALGFMGTTIIAYVPILLPPLLTARVPYRGLSRGPVYLFSIASLWRVAGYFAHDVNSLALLSWLGGPLLLAALLWFLGMALTLRT